MHDTTNKVQVLTANTIVADGCSAFVGGQAVSPVPYFPTAGYNISADASCNFTNTSDLQNENPLLGALADNGGPTQTHLPQAGSAAIDGSTATCGAFLGSRLNNVDQRGFGRPVGGLCDIGAVETGATLPDHGDAPASYGTLLSDNGPFQIATGLSLGTQRDGEADGIPTANANGDDLDQSPDDEDAFTAPLPPVIIGVPSYTTPQFTIAQPINGTYVYAWLDLNRNGQFEATERVSTPLGNAQQVNSTLTWNNLGGAVAGKTYLRLRVSNQPNLGPTGPGGIGEVEDYPLEIVQPGSIFITKETAPQGDPTSFTFNHNIGAPSSFALSDGGSKLFENVPPGSYTVTEAAVSGYTLSGLTCTEATAGSTPTVVNISTRTATINLDPGELVVCAFTNALPDHIIVEKVTVPAGGKTFGFIITDTVGSPTPFTLNHGQKYIDEVTATGSYTISEVSLGANYDLTGVSCSGGGSPVINGNQVVLNFGSLGGIASHCVFTNTQRSALVIEKQALPDGDPQNFNFTISGPGYPAAVQALADNGSYAAGNVKPGAWVVSEALPNGWDLSGIVCTSARGTSTYTPNLATGVLNVNLTPGDYMRCTFTNSKHEYVTVTKHTVPPGGSGFTFAGQPFAIGDGVSFGRELPAGQNTSIIENDPAPRGYALTGISCTDNQGNNSYQIDLANRQVDIMGAAGLSV
ncbi:MAG: hypothetical protein KDE31_35820, partial [Caldilineaceae bacterium]|nr:hypothetical protein [Caldilineaceae bacterium]